jgi:hypothetical protein
MVLQNIKYLVNHMAKILFAVHGTKIKELEKYYK